MNSADNAQEYHNLRISCDSYLAPCLNRICLTYGLILKLRDFWSCVNLMWNLVFLTELDSGFLKLIILCGPESQTYLQKLGNHFIPFCELKAFPFTKSESNTIFFIIAQKNRNALKTKLGEKRESVFKYMESLNQMAPLGSTTTLG